MNSNLKKFIDFSYKNLEPNNNKNIRDKIKQINVNRHQLIKMSNNNSKGEENSQLLDVIKQVAKEMAEAMKIQKNETTKISKENTQILNESIKFADNPPIYNDNSKSFLETNNLDASQQHVNETIKKNTRYFEDDEDDRDFYEEPETYQHKSFYEREMKVYSNQKHKLDLLRNKNMVDEKKKMSSKPQLKESTKKYIQKKCINNKPIHERLDDLLMNKEIQTEYVKKKILKDDADHKRREEEERFKKERFIYVPLVDQSTLTTKVDSDVYYNNQMDWQFKKEAKINYTRYLNEEKEKSIIQETFFKPSINKKSEKIITQKTNDKTQQNVYNKLYHNHEEQIIKKQMKILKETPKFVPTINKNYPKYIKSKRRSSADEINLTRGKYNHESQLNSQFSFLNKDSPNINEANLNDYQQEEDLHNQQEDPLIVQYRLNLERSHFKSSPVKEAIKAKTRELNEVASKIKEKQRQPDWFDEIVNVNNNTNQVLQDDDKLFKLNVRNISAWTEATENKIFITPKFTSIFKKKDT